MVIVPIEEAQMTLAELLKTPAGGEEVVIADHNFALVRLSAMSVDGSPKRSLTFGPFAGQIQNAVDFDDPLEDFVEYT